MSDMPPTGRGTIVFNPIPGCGSHAGLLTTERRKGAEVKMLKESFNACQQVIPIL
jgi:hypothetical protein